MPAILYYRVTCQVAERPHHAVFAKKCLKQVLRLRANFRHFPQLHMSQAYLNRVRFAARPQHKDRVRLR